ncbi:hypothetical protein EDC01DRAFT_599454, partial [Geopyxis carbonaria]
RVRSNYRRYGDVTSPRIQPTGRKRKYAEEATRFLVGLMEAQPDLFLDELREMLAVNHATNYGPNITVHLSTIQRMLARAGITVKKLSKIARERNSIKRAHYQLEIANYQREHFVFVDETRKDDRTTYRRYGRA